MSTMQLVDRGFRNNAYIVIRVSDVSFDGTVTAMITGWFKNTSLSINSIFNTTLKKIHITRECNIDHVISILGCMYDGGYYPAGFVFPCIDDCGTCVCYQGYVTCSNPSCSKY